MTYNQHTLTACLCRHGRQASGKSAACRLPPSCEELLAKNQNLRNENVQLRTDVEKLTEIFERARYEFEKR